MNENARESLDEMIGVDAEDLAAREGRVCERAENIKYCADAELSPNGGNCAHRRMQLRRKEKGDAGAA